MSIDRPHYSRKLIVTRSILLFLLSTLTLWGSLKLVLYHYGIETLGAWGIVTTLFGIIKLFDFGVNTNIITHTSQYTRNNDLTPIAGLLKRSLIITFTSSILISLLILWIIFQLNSAKRWIGPIAFEMIEKNIAILIFSSITGSVCLTISGLLDGLKRSDLKNISILLSQIAFAATISLHGVFYAPSLDAIVWASFCQNCLNLTLVFFFIDKKCHIHLKKLLRKTLTSNCSKSDRFQTGSLQLINIAGIISDLSSRLILQKYGTEALVGYFEVTQKVLNQGRSILITAYQASLSFLKDPEQIITFHKEEKIYHSILGVAAASVTVGAIPLSYVFFGVYNQQWIIIYLIIAIGLLINSISIPRYYRMLAESHSRIISRIQIETAIGTAFFGFLAGYFFMPITIISVISFFYALGGIRLHRSYSSMQR